MVPFLLAASALTWGCDGCSEDDLGGDVDGAQDMVTPDDPSFDEDTDEDLPPDDGDPGEGHEEPPDMEADVEGDEAEPESFTSWARLYGFFETDYADVDAIREAPDGGFLAVGGTRYGDTIGADMWVMKIDGSGNPLWQNAWVGDITDFVYAVTPAAHGGIIVAGETYDSDAGNGQEMWLLKLNAGGSFEWQKSIGFLHDDSASAVEPTVDGGFIVAGRVDYIENNAAKVGILKLGAGGDLEWHKVFGLTDHDCIVHSIRQLPGGGYVAAGSIRPGSTMDWDGWVMAMDSTGNNQWQTRIGGPEDDSLHSIAILPGGGTVAVGGTESCGAGGVDMLAVSLDESGALAWMKTYGGPEDEIALRVGPSEAGGLLAAGRTLSFATGCDDCDDIWVVEIDGEGGVVREKTYGGEADEGVVSMDVVSGGGIVLLGVTDSFGTGKRAIIIRTDDAGGIADACPPGFIGDSHAVVSEATLAVTDASMGAVDMVAGRRDASVSRQPLTALVETICGTEG